MAPVLQRRSRLARQLAIAVVVPLLLVVTLGVVLGRQVLQMSEDARWVDHTDQVLATVDETLRQIIDQETGERGYLLTSQRAFLEPFERAHPLDGFDRLHALVSDNPPQQARLDDARRRYEEWLAAVAPTLKSGGVEVARTPGEMLARKVQMDELRRQLVDAADVENGLRRQRAITSAASADATRVEFVGLLCLSGAVLAFLSRRQLSSIASTFAAALDAEKQAREATDREAWVRAGQIQLVDAIQEERTVPELAAASLAALAAACGADVGAFFTKERGAWHRRAGYALDDGAGGPKSFADGEGIVGRVASGRKLLHLHLGEVPADRLRFHAATGTISPVDIVAIPACIEGETNAVVELGFVRAIEERTLDLLGRVGESLAMAVRSAEYKQQLRELLEETQRQAEELQTQQEELRVANEELEAQTLAQKQAQKQLETQQAELEQSNDSLAQQANLLERQNQRLAETQLEIAAKAREVERASQFKSEFLSNMSHELRTPLNSSLILAKLLADNDGGRLSEEQVKFAQTIYAAGNDLLLLINDILDLSKIEAGKMDMRPAPVAMDRLRGTLQRTFEALAKEKELGFHLNVASDVPSTIETDGQRLEQVLKNLVSNALKFTERGEVSVDVGATAKGVTFAVRDTGIGIPKEQQGIIFEAFRQADGTTNRKYGGTGLGLSISRELTRLLGGELHVESEVGAGSTFTFELPRVHSGPLPSPSPAVAPREAARVLPPPPAAGPAAAPRRERDDAPVVEPGKRLVLIVEDDEPFARILAEVAHDAGFADLVATTAEQGFRYAQKYGPLGIILDVKLPDHSGLSVLDRLKRDPSTRHIPVHVISAGDYGETALAMGAVAYLLKPVQREQLVKALRALEARSSRRLRTVLVVEDDADLREGIARLLGRSDVEICTAANVPDALALLRGRAFDCVVTDLSLPGGDGYELIETMATEEPYSMPPVIVYTGHALTAEQEQRLRRYSRSIIVKGARSPERLLDEVTLFLHQVESELPPDQQRLLEQARHREAVFEGRTVLVVEDDVRNVFALTSVLESKGAHVVIARNGKEALATFQAEPRIDLVLMDVMMPEMDGLEATARIRKNPAWSRVPIIALTAKAMRDDQERCLAAGANDYLAKPLDVDMLLSLLRVWMPKT